jgi:hypothetical protein
MATFREGKAVPKSTWETHKDSLRKLYLIDKKTIKDIQAFMMETWGLDAT